VVQNFSKALRIGFKRYESDSQSLTNVSILFRSTKKITVSLGVINEKLFKYINFNENL